MAQKQSQITVRETVPDSKSTQLESSCSITVREESLQSLPQSERVKAFHGYKIIKQLHTKAGESEIFIVSKDKRLYILKLYLYGLDPKREVIQAVKSLSEKYPEDFTRIYEADFDAKLKRWYQIQEYLETGTLERILNSSKLTSELRNKLFFGVTYEIGKALYILHENNIIHRDLKPANILIRSANPFDLALIDFGIASTLPPDVSIKFTHQGGTPMYQSPESFIGAAGKASDWWALGMILLEIASGKHPFQNISSQVTALNIETLSIEIPDTLDSGQRELLHGLLLRDTHKRWRWDKVKRWLNGERGIDKPPVKPFTFMDTKCYSLDDFARAVMQNEESWERGKAFIVNKDFRMCLNEILDSDACFKINKMLKAIGDDDEKLSCLINNYCKDIPFVFCGHVVTLKNLFIFTAKQLHREQVTPFEKKITDSIDNGTLARLIDSLDFATPKLKALAAVLKKLAGNSWSYQAEFLEFYMSPENYYCPFIDDVSDILNVIEKTSGICEVPMKLSEWEKLRDNYFIPPDIMAEMKEAQQYTSAVHKLIKKHKKGLLLSKAIFTENEAEYIQKNILPFIKPEHITVEFLDFYLRPKDYYCLFAFGKDFIAESEKLKYPPEFISEWERLERRYILPYELTEKMKNAETYHEAVSQIISLEAKGLLTHRKGN